MREDYGTQLEDGSLRFVRDLPGPIERVWDYLVDPEKRALWFCGGTSGAKAGDPFIMRFNHDDISPEKLPERHAGMQGGVEMGGTVAKDGLPVGAEMHHFASNVWPKRRTTYDWNDAALAGPALA